MIDKENVVAREVAELEFDRFVEEMDLDVDTEAMDAEDRTAFDKQKRRILTAIERGSLGINDLGEPVFTPARSGDTAPITFHERTGASLMASDGKKKGHDAARTYAVMGEICKVHPSVFSKLKGSDIKVCEAIFALLMD